MLHFFINFARSTYKVHTKQMIQVFKDGTKCHECRLKSKAVKELGDEDLKMLEKGCLDVHLNAGEKIFSEGLPHSYVFFLREGFAKIHMVGPNGRDQILKIARPGAYIGIQTILGGKINHYSATALKDIQACYINVGIFKDLIRSSGAFASEILAYVCEEELNYYHRIVDQQQKQINGRLADAILYFSDEIFLSHEFTVPFTHIDLAALIGTTRESVTRALKDFKEGNIVKVSGRDFQIINYTLLKKISESG